RIVLTEISERDWPFAPAGAEGGVEAERIPLDRESAFFEVLGEETARAPLLHRQLGVRVNLARDLDEVIAGGVDGCLGSGFSAVMCHWWPRSIPMRHGSMWRAAEALRYSDEAPLLFRRRPTRQAHHAKRG